MKKQELLNIVDRLYSQLVIFPRLQENLLNIYDEISAWCKENDDSDIPMTLEEMQTNPLNDAISNATELKWELEHFLISMDELKKFVLKMYN